MPIRPYRLLPVLVRVLLPPASESPTPRNVHFRGKRHGITVGRDAAGKTKLVQRES
jgi:hypothetical protein